MKLQKRQLGRKHLAWKCKERCQIIIDDIFSYLSSCSLFYGNIRTNQTFTAKEPKFVTFSSGGCFWMEMATHI
jgi:hypothetical protein